uniref:SJCHGC07041 protein n=1 Tax=Schistosoma japonicum TaxID=6182 RepID=Q5D902_SCHJA|nr:SJCHGC07041 protein [Schistosoma japonicum]
MSMVLIYRIHSHFEHLFNYAEDMNILFYEYSHKYAKPWEWKNLAKFWGFTLDDIMAISYQDVGKNSYKQHTYRLLNIWLHGINDNQSPMNEFYLALTTIGRKRTAEQLRRRIHAFNKTYDKHKCKLS